MSWTLEVQVEDDWIPQKTQHAFSRQDGRKINNILSFWNPLVQYLITPYLLHSSSQDGAQGCYLTIFVSALWYHLLAASSFWSPPLQERKENFVDNHTKGTWEQRMYFRFVFTWTWMTYSNDIVLLLQNLPFKNKAGVCPCQNVMWLQRFLSTNIAALQHHRGAAAWFQCNQLVRRCG